MDKRMIDLLSNAVSCFDKMYSPFCHEELSKMEVTADECKDLSSTIADIIKCYISEEIMPPGIPNYMVSLLKSQKQIHKTQKVALAFGMDYVDMPPEVMKIAVEYSEAIRKDMLFLLNFVRLDWLRQMNSQDSEGETTQ